MFPQSWKTIVERVVRVDGASFIYACKVADVGSKTKNNIFVTSLSAHVARLPKFEVRTNHSDVPTEAVADTDSDNENATSGVNGVTVVQRINRLR